MEKRHKEMLTYFVDLWNDGQPCVVLYLLGGHKVKGELDFSDKDPNTDTILQEALDSEAVYLTTEDGEFKVDVSQVVAYATIETKPHM